MGKKLTIREQALKYTANALSLSSKVLLTTPGPFTPSIELIVKSYIAGRKSGMEHAKKKVLKNLEKRTLR